MKPAAMVGTEDRILNQWARFAKKYGFLPLIGGGSTKYVLNLSFAIWCCNYVILEFKTLTLQLVAVVYNF